MTDMLCRSGLHAARGAATLSISARRGDRPRNEPIPVRNLLWAVTSPMAMRSTHSWSGTTVAAT
jgi:hypothetical protein